MVNLTRDAVEFVRKIRRPFDHDEHCSIECVTVDAIQGETFDYVVLALPPPAAEWSDWLCNPNRLLTLISRHRWQLAMPYVYPTKRNMQQPRVHDTSKSSRTTTLSQPVKTLLELQKYAGGGWTVIHLMTWLTRHRPHRVWKRWLEVVKAFQKRYAEPAPTKPAHGSGSVERRNGIH